MYEWQPKLFIHVMSTCVHCPITTMGQTSGTSKFTVLQYKKPTDSPVAFILASGEVPACLHHHFIHKANDKFSVMKLMCRKKCKATVTRNINNINSFQDISCGPTPCEWSTFTQTKRISLQWGMQQC